MEFAMIDKKPHIKPYLYGMLAGFGAISLSIIFFFLIYRFDGFGDAISTLTGILMPFIYGAVIAYLLKPVCNTIEAFLRRFIPEKMKGLINALSVTFTILFGLLLVYALFMMIVPQLITSVTTLYYTAQRNFAKFVQWANHVEFFEQNTQIMDLLNSAYDTVSTSIDTLVKTKLLPSMQNIVSGAAVGVLNVVTMAKNLIIGIIVVFFGYNFIVQTHNHLNSQFTTVYERKFGSIHVCHYNCSHIVSYIFAVHILREVKRRYNTFYLFSVTVGYVQNFQINSACDIYSSVCNFLVRNTRYCVKLQNF